MTEAKKRFHIYLIKPSKYDDEGYVIRWQFAIITSNSLACLNSLTEDAISKGILGPDVDPVIHVLDETFQKVDARRFAQRIRRKGEKAVFCMVGVQTNQYARALDLCRIFREYDFPCMIGGFHVSGCLEMLPRITPEIQEALDLGVTVVAGEVENRWPDLLRAAYECRLEPVYNFVNDKPGLAGVPPPRLPYRKIELNPSVCFDAGRGCPFKCSFCTIINIQGNTMRARTAADIEALIRKQYKAGGRNVFITDDNFSRNPNWESIADMFIDLKENHGIRLSLMIQVDTACHRIPNFIKKMTHAGVRRVFIGMESVNPENLRATGKYHNQLGEYRRMLQMWRDHGALTFAGYIIGFPGDTYESIMRDVDILKRDLPLDFAEFFIMTPLPGSKDHQNYYLKGVPMEEDTNLYESAHVCMDHPKMARDELMRAYRDAFRSFYSDEHIRTLLLRRKGPRRRIFRDSLVWFVSAVRLESVHPLLSGFFRMKGRKDRRPGMPVEPFFSYYWRRTGETAVYIFRLLRLVRQLFRMTREASLPENAGYQDVATEPVPEKRPEKLAVGQ